MDLNGYFDPVSLERPEFHLLPEKYSFVRNISIHTPDRPIRNMDQHQLALIGVPQDKAAYIKGSVDAPDRVRGMLYQLRKINKNIKVYDLGNLKITDNINDTYYAIRDITLELFDGAIEELVDPDTGEVLDVDMEEVGKIKVTKVKEKVAYAKAVEGGGSIAKGMTIFKD